MVIWTMCFHKMDHHTLPALPTIFHQLLLFREEEALNFDSIYHPEGYLGSELIALLALNHPNFSPEINNKVNSVSEYFQ